MGSFAPFVSPGIYSSTPAIRATWLCRELGRNEGELRKTLTTTRSERLYALTTLAPRPRILCRFLIRSPSSQVACRQPNRGQGEEFVFRLLRDLALSVPAQIPARTASSDSSSLRVVLDRWTQSRSRTGRIAFFRINTVTATVHRPRSPTPPPELHNTVPRQSESHKTANDWILAGLEIVASIRGLRNGRYGEPSVGQELEGDVKRIRSRPLGRSG